MRVGAGAHLKPFRAELGSLVEVLGEGRVARHISPFSCYHVLEFLSMHK